MEPKAKPKAFTRIYQAAKKRSGEFQTKVKPAARTVANENASEFTRKAQTREEQKYTETTIRRLSLQSFQDIGRAASENNEDELLAAFSRHIDRSADILAQKARDLALALAGITFISKDEGGGTAFDKKPTTRKEEDDGGWGFGLGALGAWAASKFKGVTKAAGKMSKFSRFLFKWLGPVGIALMMKERVDARKDYIQKRENVDYEEDVKKYGKEKADVLKRVREDSRGIFSVYYHAKRLWENLTGTDSKTEARTSKTLEFTATNKIKFKAREIRFKDAILGGGTSATSAAPTPVPSAPTSVPPHLEGINLDRLRRRFNPRRGKNLPGEQGGQNRPETLDPKMMQPKLPGIVPNIAPGQKPGTKIEPKVGSQKPHVEGQDNAASWHNFFTNELGASKAVASGSVGSMQGESGKSLNPKALNKYSGAFGSAQWLGARKKALFEFARENKLDPNETRTQQLFYKHEVTNDPYERKMWERIMKAKTPEEAAELHTRLYERPSPKEIAESLEKRKQNAREIDTRVKEKSDSNMFSPEPIGVKPEQFMPVEKPGVPVSSLEPPASSIPSVPHFIVSEKNKMVAAQGDEKSDESGEEYDDVMYQSPSFSAFIGAA